MIIAGVAVYLIVGWWCMFRCMLSTELWRDLIEDEDWADFWGVVVLSAITSWVGIPALLTLTACRRLRWPGLRPSELARKLARL